MSNNTKEWEQLQGESNEAYARFLVYRNLGIGRTLVQAYELATGKVQKGSKRVHASGQWQREAKDFNWQSRATAWDSWQLENVVPQATTTIFKLIEEAAKVSLAQVLNGSIKPANWQEFKEMVVILAGFISPEVVTATIDNARNTEP